MSGLSIFSKTSGKPKETESKQSKIDAFLEKATGRPQGVGRLIFVLDATASRGPIWDMTRGLTGDMIREATSVGRLELQLVFFRGGSDRRQECVASDWLIDPVRFAQIMAKTECRAGYTQIVRALSHAKRETTKSKVNAIVLIGDACEPIEDAIDLVCEAAAELEKLKTPVFAFLEGRNPEAEKGFRTIATMSGGAFGRFDAGSAKQLGDLLKAVGVFAAGGVIALQGRNDPASTLLLAQMRKG